MLASISMTNGLTSRTVLAGHICGDFETARSLARFAAEDVEKTYVAVTVFVIFDVVVVRLVIVRVCDMSVRLLF
jgi:hypothetical protein